MSFNLLEWNSKLGSADIHLLAQAFGTANLTAYSTVSWKAYRLRMIDTIKIDRSFIAEVSSNNDDSAITEAITSMAHSLNLKVIAEGVENGEQLRFLERRNCDEVQGYYLARPMPVHDLMAYLARPDRKSAIMKPRWQPELEAGEFEQGRVCQGISCARR